MKRVWVKKCQLFTAKIFEYIKLSHTYVTNVHCRGLVLCFERPITPHKFCVCIYQHFSSPFSHIRWISRHILISLALQNS